MLKAFFKRLKTQIFIYLMRFEDGGAEGDRTLDLRLAKPALSQLSYGPIEPCPRV